jgi:probable HAF family extracellular repeat protein
MYGPTGRLATLALLALGASGSWAATFTAIGGLPSPLPTSSGLGVSGDGTVVVGWSAAPGTEAFRWTQATGLVGLGDLGAPGTSSTAYGVSTDGNVVAGSAASFFGTTQAFRWTSATGMVNLGGLSGFSGGSEAFAISADGEVIVGGSDRQAFRWTSASGMTGLGDLPGGEANSIALGVSANGDVVVGTGRSLNAFDVSRREAFVWTAAGGLHGLGTLEPGTGESMAHGVSADGLVIVGEVSNPDGIGWQPFRWESSTGLVGLGDIASGSGNARARAVSGDGSVIVGTAGISGSEAQAFIWTAESGLQALFDVLVARGATVPDGWRIVDATAISADGRWVTGRARTLAGGFEAYVADLSPIPVPGAAWLFASGVGFLAAAALRRRR